MKMQNHGGKRLRKKQVSTRGLSLLLCLSLVLGLFSGLFTLPSRAVPTGAAGVEDDILFNGKVDLNDRDLTNATHFVFRHWHSVDTTGLPQSTTLENSVLVAGYIFHENGGYQVYARAYQGGVEMDDAGTDYREDLDDFTAVTATTGSKYMKLSGNSLVITAAPRAAADGDYYEKFSGFSVVTGQQALVVDNKEKDDYDGELTIDLAKTDGLHQIKSHLFYSSDNAPLPGQITYIGTGDQYPDYLDVGYDADGNAYYNSNEGMHTDAAATPVGDDGRTFDLDLRSWYNGANLNVGFVLDASGSMIFTQDDPTAINALEVLGIKEAGGKYVHEDGTPIDQSKEPYLYSIAEKLEKGLTGESQTVNTYPQKGSMIGYYSFTANNHADGKGGNTGRDWLKNDVNGVYANKLNGQERFQSDSFAFDVDRDTNMELDWPGNGIYGISMVGNNGINVTGANMNNAAGSADGVLVNTLRPLGTSFTVSFTVYGEGTLSGESNLLYIGPLSGNVADGNYYRAYRTTDNKFKSIAGNDLSSVVTDADAFVGAAIGNKHVITLVYDGTTMTTYMDSKSQGTQKLALSSSVENYIILDAIYDGIISPTTFIDDLFIYDTALGSGDVYNLYNQYTSDKGNAFANTAKIEATKTLTPWDFYFLTEDELALLLNPNKTDNTPIGANGYSYFVYYNSAYQPLGYWNGSDRGNSSGTGKVFPVAKYGSTVIGRLRVDGGRGWYFVSHSGSKEDGYGNPGLFSGKQMFAVNRNWEYIDADISETVHYIPSSNTSIRFYVGSDGILRSFFSTADETNSKKETFTSYVYELSDTQYVRTEALQRALGVFTSNLVESASTALVSAVRFSSSSLVGDEVKTAVLLDWTDDPVQMSKIVSQIWGKDSAQGTTYGFTESNSDSTVNKVEGLDPIEQYNYFLTGGTYTNLGLAAFYSQLATRLAQYEDASQIQQSHKYVILFTDGDNNDGYNEETRTIVNTAINNMNAVLKNKLGGISTKASGWGTMADVAKALYTDFGYTVIPVACGDVTSPDALVNLWRVSGGDPGLAADDLYFAKTADELTQMFDDILQQIIDTLDGYNIKQYLDPRFNIIDADGKLWNLNAGGKVTVGSDIYTLSDVTGQQIKLSDYYVNASGGDSRKYYGEYATLYYDSTNDMYYLLWNTHFDAVTGEYIEGVTIPNLPVGATNLEMWHAKITLRAKDDFVGGNAVSLTGNTDMMNYVWFPGGWFDDLGNYVSWSKPDTDAKWKADVDGNENPTYSSGIDDIYRKGETPAGWTGYAIGSRTTADDFPSRGFPRVTVNVKLLDLAIGSTEDRIYLGQTISPKEIIYGLGNTLVIGDEYWTNYLIRYAPKYIMEHPEEFIDGLKEGQEPTQEQLRALEDWVKDPDANDLMDKMLQALVDHPDGWGLDIPYSYLPEPGDNNTVQAGLAGDTGQQSDVLGSLHYRWLRLDPETATILGEHDYADSKDSPDYDDTGPFKGIDYETLDTRRILYRLTVSYWPYPDDADDFWAELNEWDKNEGEKYPDYQTDPGKTRLQTLLDGMDALLNEASEMKDVNGNATDGGLSAMVQSANTQAAMEYIESKYDEITGALNSAGLPEDLMDGGTFTTLMEDIYKALYENRTTITINLTKDDDSGGVQAVTETHIITGGLDGLLTALDDVKNPDKNAPRTEIDNNGDPVEGTINETNRQAYRVYLEAALFNLRNDIDNLISQASNYIDYLRWCYGYGETTVTGTDDEGNPTQKTVQTWLEENEKFTKRDDENDELITDADYSFKSAKKTNNSLNGPKDAVGEAQYNKAAIGMATVRVVRGELAFELELSMEDLEFMFTSGSWKDKKDDGTAVPYYVSLKREYGTAGTDDSGGEEEQASATADGDETAGGGEENAGSGTGDAWSPAIPTELEIGIKYSDLQKLKSPPEEGDDDYIEGEVKPQENGDVYLYYLHDGKATEYPKAVLSTNDDGKKIVTFYTDPTVFDPDYEGYGNNNDYARLLPIGTYTMKPSARNETLWSMFGTEMFYASAENYYFDSWHFTRTTNEGEPNNSVDSIYFPRSGRSQKLGLGQLKAPETNKKNNAGELTDETLGVVFQLGTHEYSEGDYYSGTTGRNNADGIPQYTDDRVGMARITAELLWYDAPATGGEGLTEQVHLWGMALLALGGCLGLAFVLGREKAHGRRVAMAYAGAAPGKAHGRRVTAPRQGTAGKRVCRAAARPRTPPGRRRGRREL